MFLFETKLKRVNKFVIFKECVKSITHNSFKDFVNIWQMEIDRYFEHFTLESFFIWIDITLLVFKMLKREASRLDTFLFKSLRTSVEKLFGPTLKMMLEISLQSVN